MTGRTVSRFAAAIEARSRSIARAAARRPRRVATGWMLLTLAALPGLAWLERDTDGLALLPPASEALAVDREIRRLFGLRDQVIVLVGAEGERGVLTPDVLAMLDELSEAARALDGIGRHHVTSLATEPRDRLYPGTGETFGSFVEPLPRTAEERRELAEDLDLPAARLLVGTVLSADRRWAAILVGAPDDLRQRLVLVRQLDNLADAVRRSGLTVEVVGAPVASARLADHILLDLVRLIPLSLVVVAWLIWLGTRRVAAVALALGKVALCIVWTFGVLGWLGLPVYLTVAIVPVILAAMAIADEIHLLMRYRRELLADPHGALERTVDAMATPVVVATATTCIGFLSCLATGIPPIQVLGAGAAIGTAYSLGFSLLVTPALFAVLPAAWFAGDPERVGSASRVGATSQFALRRPIALVTLLMLISLGALVGTRRLVVQDSWIDCFAEDSALRRATDSANRALFGVHVLYARLRLDDAERSLLEPAMLDALAAFDSAARGAPTVGGVIGLVDQLDVVASFWDIVDWRHDPDEAMHTISRFDFAPGQSRRQRVVIDSFDQAVTTIFLRDANYRDTDRLLTILHDAHRRHLQPLGVRLDFGGDIALSQALIPAIVRGQVASLPLALLGVLLSVALLCGSWRLALAALVPVTLAALWLLGGLGWVGVPLGVATSMFFVLSIGLGVDSHAIHLIARVRETWRRLDPDPVRTAVREVRPAILINSTAIAAGFGVLAVSTVPPNRDLGLLVATAILLGCWITLGGLVSVLDLLTKQRSRNLGGVQDAESEGIEHEVAEASVPIPLKGVTR